MRLLHTSTFKHQVFEGDTTPSHAILSHRWSSSEVSYPEYRDRQVTNGPGYEKILRLCALAKSRGLEWAWIDTCCIDKASSAELTESINSMWAYYRGSAECYAYLADMPDEPEKCPVMTGELSTELLYSLRRSEWFTRGWTLQELIGPRDVLFCTSGWTIFATKAKIADDLASITGIATHFLLDPNRVGEASIAARMSRASRRKTTRKEDLAYCLLGLFDVSMPMLYGEGDKAFMRLQKKIIKKYDDESIFAWREKGTQSGMLASGPAAFIESGGIVALPIPPEHKMQYQMTNKGLELRIPSTVRYETRVPVGGHRRARPEAAEYRPLRRPNSRPALDALGLESVESIRIPIRMNPYPTGTSQVQACLPTLGADTLRHQRRFHMTKSGRSFS